MITSIMIRAKKGTSLLNLGIGGHGHPPYKLYWIKNFQISSKSYNDNQDKNGG